MSSWMLALLAIGAGCGNSSKTTANDATAPGDGAHVGSGGAGGIGGTTSAKDAGTGSATGGMGAGGSPASGGAGAGGTSGSSGGADARVDLPTKSDPRDVGVDILDTDTPGERCDVPPVVCQTDGVCGQPCCATVTTYGRHCNGAGGSDYFVCSNGVWGKMTMWDDISCVPPIAGVDASKPLPDGGAPDSPTPPSDGPGVDTALDGGTVANEIVRACALASSCAAFGSAYSATHCISEFARTASRQDESRLTHLLACASRSNCVEFQSCWGGGLFTLEAYVTGAICSGNMVEVIPAGASAPLQWDCTAMGGVCIDPVTDVPRAGCYAHSCDGIGAGSCDGMTANGCNNGLYTSVDCARSGRACQLVGQGTVCAGTGAVCDTSEKVTCSGSIATYCSRGARATVDCASTGLATRCAADANPAEPCAAAGTECNPSSFVDQCNNTALKLCVNGFIVSVECTRLGLVSCDVPSNSYAHCRPGT